MMSQYMTKTNIEIKVSKRIRKSFFLMLCLHSNKNKNINY